MTQATDHNTDAVENGDVVTIDNYMDKPVVLDVEHVDKWFKLPTEQATGLKQAFINWTKGIKGFKKQQVLKDVTFQVHQGEFFGIVGRNGGGKSTLLKSLNRMNDLIPGTRTEGLITLDKEDINAPNFDVVNLRRRVGMVFQKPTPFPKTIFENVAYGLRVNGERDESLIADKVEESLRRAAIFEEVKDRLHTSRSGSPAASSSACASPAPLPWNRKSCSWTNPPAPSTPSPRSASRKASTNSRASSASSSLPTVCSRPPASPTAPPFSIWAS